MLVLAALAGVPARAATCGLHVGANVTLRSSDFDPDVFVWDTQGRVIAYATRLNELKVDDVLRHIVLAKPGTRAVVVGCAARSVRFGSGVEDAVLVRLATGPNRGHLGWVASGDVHA